MKNTLIGLVATAEQLDAARPGLHYAPEVFVLEHQEDQPLPPTGRGHAVRAPTNGGRLVGSVAVLWGTDAAVSRQLVTPARRCLVVLLTSKAQSRTISALRRLQRADVEVHLCQAAQLPLRVLPGPVVQSCAGGAWRNIDTSLPPEKPKAAPEATVELKKQEPSQEG